MNQPCPWSGGGEHFSFFNQPQAAEANYLMFWASIRLLLADNTTDLARLDEIHEGFAVAMNQAIEVMRASKLGLNSADASLVDELHQRMVLTKIDYTVLARIHSTLPEPLLPMKESFYLPGSEQLDAQWAHWLQRWRHRIQKCGNRTAASGAIQRVNPKITWREWLIAPAYEQAALGDTSMIKDLQMVFRHPYVEPSAELATWIDRRKSRQFFHAGGISLYSCSS